MDILISTDNKYVMPAGVMLTSLFENNKDEPIHVHVIIDSSFTELSKSKLIEIIKNYDNRITFHSIDPQILAKFPVGKDGLPISTYYRLFAGEIIPHDISKILYLDCDMVVLGSLYQLYKTDLTDKSIAAVIDQNAGDLYRYNRLQLPLRFDYINAGLLLINLDYWRKNNLQHRFKQFILSFPERIVFSDQDVLNYICNDSKLILPLKYNVQQGFYLKKRKMPWTMNEEINDAIMNPSILHFCMRIKPWHEHNRIPNKEIWHKYQDLTIWKGINWKTKESYKSIIRQILGKIGIKKYNLNPYNDNIIINQTII